MTEVTTDARHAAQQFLADRKEGVLATTGPDGNPQASLVYYIADEDFNIYLLTLSASRKYMNVQKHPHVAFTVAETQAPQTVQLEGVAEEVPVDTPAAQDTVAELMQVLSSGSHYPPLTKMDPSRVVLLRITPTSVRWGDFMYSGHGSENVFHNVLEA